MNLPRKRVNVEKIKELKRKIQVFVNMQIQEDAPAKAAEKMARGLGRKKRTGMNGVLALDKKNVSQIGALLFPRWELALLKKKRMCPKKREQTSAVD